MLGEVMPLILDPDTIYFTEGECIKILNLKNQPAFVKMYYSQMTPVFIQKSKFYRKQDIEKIVENKFKRYKGRYLLD